MQIEEIKSIKKIDNDYDRYDLEIEDNNNFFENGILVHNCRCISIKKDGDIKFYSRNGKEFNTLNNLRKELLRLTKKIDNFVLDGEICIVDENGNENFQSIMKEISKKDHTIKTPGYFVFDILTIDDFNSKESHINFDMRYTDLYKLLKDKSDTVKPLEQIRLEDEQTFLDLQTIATKNKWEGLILRKGNVPYKGKRSNDLLKVKKFHDAEYVVTGIETGEFTYADKKLGRQETIETMTAVLINHKSKYIVKVGSGWTIEQRKRYFEHPEQIVRKTITVQYFEETKNKQGGISLRFPTVKHVYENGRST